MAPECAEITIPDHRHEAELGLWKADLLVAYGASHSVTITARMPYEIKDQLIEYRTLDGQRYDPPYGDIHHRTGVHQGVGDAEVLASYALGSDWLIGAGFTIPTGETQPNPIEAGRLGLVHQHLLFGSGTVDPRIGVQWTRHVAGVRLIASADARIPVYENRHGFRAPATVRWSAGPSVPVGTTGLALQWAGQYQSIGKWSGEIDEGTGFHNGGVFLNASFLLPGTIRVSPGIYVEAYSNSLSDQSFTQKPTFSVVISRLFR